MTNPSESSPCLAGPASEEEPWYKDGLRFSCTGCGKCCRGAPGFVWVDQPAIAALAQFLEISPEEFSSKYVRRVGHRLSLIEKPNYDCIFWKKGQGCSVYSVRPIQCRTFPFWPENLDTPAEWETTVTNCPGSGEGKFFPVELIRKIMNEEAET